MSEERKEVAVKAGEKAPAPKEGNKLLALEADFSRGIFASGSNFALALKMAEALAGSTIVPQNFQKSPQNCLIAIEQANRLGMSPFLVMQNLFIIQGRPAWSSSWIIAMVNKSGLYDMDLQYEEKKD